MRLIKLILFISLSFHEKDEVIDNLPKPVFISFKFREKTSEFDEKLCDTEDENFKFFNSFDNIKLRLEKLLSLILLEIAKFPNKKGIEYA